jgi:hypothetical protein
MEVENVGNSLPAVEAQNRGRLAREPRKRLKPERRALGYSTWKGPLKAAVSSTFSKTYAALYQ